MKKYALSALLFGCAFPLFAQKQEAQRKLTDAEKIEGLSRLWEGVRNNFVYYDQLKFSWDSLYVASIQKVLDIKDTYAYIKELERLAASVKDGHTYIFHNVKPDIKDRITPAPFTTRFVEGKVLVDKVWSSDLIEKGVKRGVEVVSVDGVDVISYGEKVIGQYVSSSTKQWLDTKVFESYALTKGKRTMPLNVEFANGSKRFTLVIARDSSWDLQEIERKSGKSEGENYTSIQLSTLKNNIGLLKVRDFMNDSFTQLFDSIYPKVMRTNALVIDLRDNGGGRSDNADYILSHLSMQPIKTSSWSSRMYIPAHASWNYPQEWYLSSSEYLTPVDAKKAYSKPVVVLVNAGTFSSSEDFCVKFRGMKRGMIVGSATGGSTGNGVRITLIEGVAGANICSKKDIAPDGTVFVGVGVIPDIQQSVTIEDFMSGKDAILDTAIRELSKEIR